MNQKSILRIALLCTALVGTAVFAQDGKSFDEAPMPLRTTAPAYPSALRADGVAGMVSVAVAIDENGNVTSASVAKSSHAEFEKPALAAVSQWKFKPAMKGGQAVAAKVILPIRFSAND